MRVKLNVTLFGYDGTEMYFTYWEEGLTCPAPDNRISVIESQLRVAFTNFMATGGIGSFPVEPGKKMIFVRWDTVKHCQVVVEELDLSDKR